MPIYCDGVVTVKVLVLLPLADELLFIQVALQAPQLLQLPTQLTEQSVFIHCSVTVNELGQAIPPLADGVVIVKVLVLLPFADELLFIHVALQELQFPQLPTELFDDDEL